MSKKKEAESMRELQKLAETLSRAERIVLQNVNLEFEQLCKTTGLDSTTAIHCLAFLAKKGLLKLSFEEKKLVVLDTNGVLYSREGLPERKLLNALEQKPLLNIEEAATLSKLSENEFRAALGVLKKKDFVVVNGKIALKVGKEKISEKLPQENFLEQLPLALEKLTKEQQASFEELSKRKNIIMIEKAKKPLYEITSLGKELEAYIKSVGTKEEPIEKVSRDVIEKELWKGKHFRRYDVSSAVPNIYGGKRQPYAAFLEFVRDKLVQFGFEEMTGSIVENEFWNFDALFQPQFHVAREWSSTYYVKNKLQPEHIERKIVAAVKAQHEKSWRYSWKQELAARHILRPQGTVLSARQLASSPKIPGKYFAIARCYRPDVVDAKHLSEFNQVEGIIIKQGLTLRNLFSILELFAKEIADAKEVQFRPSYFPFTEPSVELYAKHEKFGWIELGGAGILRREVVVPLLGKDITVLAWGLGVDRLAMLKLGINDIRELFSQNLEWLRTYKEEYKEVG